MLEWIEKLLDKYLFGSGTSSTRPEGEVADAIENGAFILDVRTGLEAKKGTAPGATNIDLLVLTPPPGRAARDRTIVTYCKTGGRAGKARDILNRNGFTAINGGGYETVAKIVKENRPRRHKTAAVGRRLYCLRLRLLGQADPR